MGLRISKAARARFSLGDALLSDDGEAIVEPAASAERLAEAVAPDGDADGRARLVADLASLDLLHALAERAIERERESAAIDPIEGALSAARTRLGGEPVERALTGFEAAYPVAAVRDGTTAAAARLVDPGAPTVLEALLLTALDARNPAAASLRPLVGDPVLHAGPTTSLLAGLGSGDVAPTDPPLAPLAELVARLEAPARAAPASLAGQLRWIRVHWAGWLRADDLLRIDRHLAHVGELARAAWLRRQAAAGASADAAALAGFSGLDAETEAFSEDRDWMADLVLQAKSTYVWLAQLTRAYGRPITRLDEIPDAELDELHDRGISGLWLIGLWQRSAASARIKRMRGDSEAMASAYAVADYRIADELGGDDAWHDLRDRAAARGIRLAADMVPNHMGLDADWVAEHPDRFIWSPHPPYESYTFEGKDLADDPRVEIRLEDHYWDASDAAVVFQRRDAITGEVRYLYHGNDGTSFAWNDTAQLDYLRADVREAVIEQILDVARRFSVIRFDAAMVLARRHIQRLWYPLPGHEPGVPSRDAAALSAEDFARLLPLEFWREVVDRVAAEVPDTLLLAEAFWLMEGFFVRTLGMHRVYNSAFMHMLRDEDNAGYQAVIAETVAFDRRILGRYVNFMSNPDERTAADQYGSDDKYFGVATLLATMPGLPMIGHGQFEGLQERYGMEFARPRLDEAPDEWLVDRHRREIVPLLRQRWRFADASGFRQLRAIDGGAVVDDVFALANRPSRAPRDAGETRSLVIVLNRYERAHVHIPDVAAALDITVGPGDWVVLHDDRSGRGFLRRGDDLTAHGLELSLDGYACHVFLGFDVVGAADADGLAAVSARYGLDGIDDVEGARRRELAAPVRDAVRAVFDDVAVTSLLAVDGPHAPDAAASSGLLGAIARVRAELDLAVGDPDADAELIAALSAAAVIRPGRIARVVAAWILARAVTPDADPDGAPTPVQAWRERDIADRLGEAMRRAGGGDDETWRVAELTAALVALRPGALEAAATSGPGTWFDDAAVRGATGWHRGTSGAFVVAEAWDELLVVLARRDALVGRTGAEEAAATVREAMKTAGYRTGDA